MKDSQHVTEGLAAQVKYIKESNERFSTMPATVRSAT